jgi:hypothetical protein
MQYKVGDRVKFMGVTYSWMEHDAWKKMYGVVVDAGTRVATLSIYNTDGTPFLPQGYGDPHDWNFWVEDLLPYFPVDRGQLLFDLDVLENKTKE